jgi:predicted polyphosphate/ATP-dependent NAD kinase
MPSTLKLQRIGFVVNPIAGMGGKIGLHGTDGDRRSLALLANVVPISFDRARKALYLMERVRDKLVIYAADGELGGDLLQELGFKYINIGVDHGLVERNQTTAAHTIELVQEMQERKVDLILFAGGDGTARDIYSVVGDRIPIIGIPAGVKMRSGVFASYPEGAGEIVVNTVIGKQYEIVHSEILDVGESTCDRGDRQSTFFGVARTINSRLRLQHPKLVFVDHGAGIHELANKFAHGIESDHLYLFGPGQTTALFLDALGCVGSLHGIDAYSDGELVGKDLSEEGILELLTRFSKTTLVLGVIGGQGFLLGRGNQQLSTKVLTRIGVTNILVVSDARKISSLVPTRLYVDLGDCELPPFFPEYFQVHTSPRRCTLVKIVSSNSQVPTFA